MFWRLALWNIEDQVCPVSVVKSLLSSHVFSMTFTHHCLVSISIGFLIIPEGQTDHNRGSKPILLTTNTRDGTKSKVVINEPWPGPGHPIATHGTDNIMKLCPGPRCQANPPHIIPSDSPVSCLSLKIDGLLVLLLDQPFVIPNLASQITKQQLQKMESGLTTSSTYHQLTKGWTVQRRHTSTKLIPY